MKKQVLKSKDIYGIGDKVLKSVRMSDEEIDRIVAAPDLVERVRAGIASAPAPADPKGWAFLYILRRGNAWAAIAVVLVLAVAIGWMVLEKQNYKANEIAGFVQPPKVPQIDVGGIDIPEIGVVADGISKVSELSRRETPRAVKTRSQVKRVNQAKEIEMGEFQALTYAGEQEEPGEGGRIVRVELSPASLFAMGVDVAVENETGKVKADLLIGADGVMKSVRVEKRN